MDKGQLLQNVVTCMLVTRTVHAHYTNSVDLCSHVCLKIVESAGLFIASRAILGYSRLTRARDFKLVLQVDEEYAKATFAGTSCQYYS